MTKIDQWHYKNNPPLDVEIVLCGECKGEGNLWKEICEDYHRGEYRYEPIECKRCNNTGRLRKTTRRTYEALQVNKLV